MQVEIQYIEGCPSLPLALARVRAALAALGMDAEESTTMKPKGVPFAGSPTVLIGGRDVCPPGLITVMGIQLPDLSDSTSTGRCSVSGRDQGRHLRCFGEMQSCGLK